MHNLGLYCLEISHQFRSYDDIIIPHLEKKNMTLFALIFMLEDVLSHVKKETIQIFF